MPPLFGLSLPLSKSAPHPIMGKADREGVSGGGKDGLGAVTLAFRSFPFLAMCLVVMASYP